MVARGEGIGSSPQTSLGGRQVWTTATRCPLHQLRVARQTSPSTSALEQAARQTALFNRLAANSPAQPSGDILHNMGCSASGNRKAFKSQQAEHQRARRFSTCPGAIVRLMDGCVTRELVLSGRSKCFFVGSGPGLTFRTTPPESFFSKGGLLGGEPEDLPGRG